MPAHQVVSSHATAWRCPGLRARAFSQSLIPNTIKRVSLATSAISLARAQSVSFMECVRGCLHGFTFAPVHLVIQLVI